MNILSIRQAQALLTSISLVGVLFVTGCTSSDNGDGTLPAAVLETHEEHYIENPYTGTDSCLECHEESGGDILMTGHWNWSGLATNVADHESGLHGKNDFINNFCIAVPSNEGRCSQCHIGYGYVDNTFDFNDANNIDCLVCHDQTGTYKKSKTAAGNPDPSVDLLTVAKSVGQNGGVPQRKNCLVCHAFAGGGDNVKHGDLSSALIDTTRAYDVHMGSDGENQTCVVCHDVQRTAAGELTSHGIGGMPYYAIDEGVMKGCRDCHGDNDEAHQGRKLGGLFIASDKPIHQRLACQVCHIPLIARQVATTTHWDWSEAGQDIDPIPTDPVTGRATYDKKKGSFVWGLNVTPVLRVHNGKWKKAIVGVNDGYDPAAGPVILAEPAAEPDDPDAMIYPFKRMTGKQVADADNHTLLVPHLFGTAGGPNPYWGAFEWGPAVEDGASYTQRPYSGNYTFVDTIMFLAVNHEVAPKEMSLGKGGQCSGCHSEGQIDWPALGWPEDPHEMGGE